MRLRHVLASILAAGLLVGCSSEPAPAAERVREVVDSAGATQIGHVKVRPTAVQVTYLDGTEAMVATKTSGDVSSAAGGSGALLTTPVGVDQLGLDEFTTRLAALQGCADGTFGTIQASHGGAVVQQMGCSNAQGGQVKETYLDGELLATIDGWTEASIDAQLAEFRSMIGAQAVQLGFFTPRSATSDPAYRSLAISAPITGVDGNECFVKVRRAGEASDDGLVNYLGCEGATPLGDGTFELDEVSGTKILAALGRGAEKLKISVEDIGDFTVISVEGELRVQIQVASGVTAESPVWAEPIR